MAIRDKIARNAQPHLEPGEVVQGVLSGQTRSQFLILVGVLPFLIVNRYRTIIATDRRILVLDSGVWTTTKAKRVVAVFPRAVHLGPWTSAVWHRVLLGEELLRVHRRFKGDIEKIDALAPAAPAA